MAEILLVFLFNVLLPNIFDYGETEFIIWAKKQGAKKMTQGLGMLIEQAAVSFNLWFNISLTEKDIKEVREICEASY